MKKKVVIVFVCLLLVGALAFAGYKLFQNKDEKIKISAVTGIKSEYLVDEPFLNASTSVQIKLSNKETKNVKISDLTIQGFDSSTTGTKTMKIIFEDYNYNLSYAVKYKEISLYYKSADGNSTSSVLPTDLIYGKTLSGSQYRVSVSTYSGRLLDFGFDDDEVTISNLYTNTISTAKKTASVTCGGISATFQYTVWWTQLNKECDKTIEKDNYSVTVNYFQIKTDGSVSGRLNIKNKQNNKTASVNFATWELNGQNSVYIYDSSNKHVATYSFSNLLVFENQALDYQVQLFNVCD